MKFRRPNLLASCIAGALLLTAIPASAEQVSQPISVYYAPMNFVFDGKHLAPPEGMSGFIYEGSTYVPLRFISYALDKGVGWDGETYTVSVQAPTIQQKVEIQDYKLNREIRENKPNTGPVVVPDPTQIEVYFEKVQYIFDNKQIQPSNDLPGLIYENSLYVPTRFFSEAIGKEIKWDPNTYTVSADTAAPVKPNVPNPPVVPPVGGGVSDPILDSLKSAAEGSLFTLKDEAFNYFTSLYFNYMTADAETKISLKSEGKAKMSEFDSRFEVIIGDLQTKLKANGYSLDILATYREQYESEKAAAQAIIG